VNNRLKEGLEALDLSAWIQNYVDILDAGEGEIRIQECPECGETKWKLFVNVWKKRWHCKHCDWGRGIGDVVHFMASLSGRSLSDIRIEILKQHQPAKAGDIIQLLQSAFTSEQEDEADELNKIVVPGRSLCEENLGYIGGAVKDYAHLRGLIADDLLKYRLQYSQSIWINKTSGNSIKISGPFLVFPVFDFKIPVAFQARQISDRQPRFISSFNIGDFLWPLDGNLFKLYKPRETLYLVEGMFDVIGMLRMGFPAVCTFGKTLSNKQLKRLRELAPGRVVVAWDADAKTEISNVVNRLIPYFSDVAVIPFSFEVKKDPGDTLQSVADEKLVRKFLETPISYKSWNYFKWTLR